ncbi:hypothetical protein [Kitasatospora sp. MAP5-34]|uniref:hypothetical protein n=1 Tax=Kitasatospora sp. MAP5-34 TaxID=3035102 RepID=UPI002474E7B7|nr:hypothetical protein [Kitasatospora sp. MAP5-34]MDH6576472.1 hypothetical protein [Kitasatospora sp. MAP5-34]
MNLDFSAEPLFSWYVVLLCFSGIAMIVIGAVKSAALSTGWRIFNVVAGLGFVGYGVYLGFIFQGGHYVIFFKAFILPVMMIVNFFRSLGARSKTSAPQPMARPMAQPVPPQAVVPQDAVPQPVPAAAAAAAENQVG